jgi:ABC-type dipeptide/oligopeptide/nickel transport system ATPase component
MSDNILRVKNLKVYFHTSSGVVRAVDGASFDVEKGKVFGLVGESGSGKTLTALSILRLVSPPGKIVAGQILFNDMDILGMEEGYLRSIRGSKISIVFQEPASALNPVFTVGYQIAEAVMAHQRVNKRQAQTIAMEYLQKVHISEPEKIYHDYPHQLSGGMKQCACIAMALVNSPQLVILDEPTTALDVTVQAQVLDLLEEISERDKLTMLFISHDLGIIARMCDDVGVMFKGRIIEQGGKEDIISDPKEPYTISLLESAKALLW